MVAAVRAATGKVQARTRDLPSRVVAYLLLAAGLFAEPLTHHPAGRPDIEPDRASFTITLSTAATNSSKSPASR